LQFYFVEGLPESIGYWLAGAVVVGLLFICFNPTFKTIVYLTLLTVLFAGTCLNPRHWVRWILPMLPLLSLLAGFAITTTYKLIVRLLSKFTPETVANNCSFIIVIAFVIYGWFFPIRHLIYDQYQKGQLSARAEAYPWMLAHIPKHTKIVVDTGWDWPKVEDYNVTSNIWRPDFVPPRPHNYYFPEDLAKEGFEYMVVETWNRDYYQWDESEKKYPREHAFYKRLREDAPLVLNTFDENRPWILGHILPYRVSPIEIYDLRPLARKKLHAP
jgi:hypothetical protein